MSRRVLHRSPRSTPPRPERLGRSGPRGPRPPGPRGSGIETAGTGTGTGTGPNPPLAWIRRLVAFAESSPCSSRPAPGRRPCTTAPPARGFARCSPPRAMPSRRARTCVSWRGGWNRPWRDSSTTTEWSTTTRKTQSATTRKTHSATTRARAEHIGTHPRAQNASRLRTLFRSPPSRRFATARCGRTARRSTRFFVASRPNAAIAVDYSRAFGREPSLVDARARADAESQWVAERARSAGGEGRRRAREARGDATNERR